MDNTIKIAATGLASRTQSINLTSNNLSNIETAGYKHSEIVSSTFGEYITYRIDEESQIVGSTTYGSVINKVYTDFSQGTITETNQTLDFALDGNGFFTVSDNAGNTMLTRDGRFSVDDNGFLVDINSNFVMGQKGRINVGSSAISVSESGVITSGGNIIDILQITVPEDTAQIYKLSDSMLFNPNGNTMNFTGKVIQGSIEKANVDLTDEMAAMIEDSRAFQTCSQIVRMADQLLQKTVTEVGRV
ncbi:MAG: hypothetical protein A2Y17_04295 [Clostridiales bacterium GWF2_38_85]|nr:MAG: hypothetical protein A2Y17_04295 [Clostridiales bacterium GWF2_38_85]